MQNQTITVPQQNFVDALLDGAGSSEAARKAGINPSHSGRMLHSVAVNRKLCSHARAFIRGKIDLEGSPAAYRIMIELLHSPTTSTGHKIEIAKFLINHSVPAPKAPEDDSGEEKQPHEMSDAELQQSITQIDGELRQRGMLIDVIPSQAIDDLI